MKVFYGMLVFVPLTFIAEFVHLSDGIIFILCAIGIVPLAKLLGDATEQISMYSGPKVGGFLNATMGNVPELLICSFTVKEGLFGLAIASLVGSVLGNVLLVMGMSILLGGIRYKFLSFNKNITQNNFTLLGFAAFSLVMPFFFQYLSTNEVSARSIDNFSLILAVIMVAIYVLGLFFSLFTHRDIFHDHTSDSDTDDDDDGEAPKWSLRKSILFLAVITVFMALMSEVLVSTVEVAAEQYGLSDAFIGIILIPILGNVAEHAAALMMAYKGKLNISIEIAIGSSMQISLFVLPLIVIFSNLIGSPMAMVLTPLELVSVVMSIVLASSIFADHKVNWLEGAQLLTAYVILGGAFLIFGIG